MPPGGVVRDGRIAIGAPVAQRMARAGTDNQRRPVIGYQALGICRGGLGERDTPAEHPLTDSECGGEAEKAIQHVLAGACSDPRIGEEPLQLARARAVEAQFDIRRNEFRDQAGSKRHLHVQQCIESAPPELLAQLVTRTQAGALVDGDKLDTVEEGQQTRFGLTDDPRQLGVGPGML